MRSPGGVAPALSGRQILVVEDDEAVVALLETALVSRGAVVRVVRKRAEPVAALAVPHDAAIVDLSPLGGMLHEDLARIQASSRPGAPLVLATGSAARVPLAVLDGARVHLVRKPFELREVLDAVSSGSEGP